MKQASQILETGTFNAYFAKSYETRTIFILLTRPDSVLNHIKVSKLVAQSYPATAVDLEIIESSLKLLKSDFDCTYSCVMIVDAHLDTNLNIVPVSSPTRPVTLPIPPESPLQHLIHSIRDDQIIYGDIKNASSGDSCAKCSPFSPSLSSSSPASTLKRQTAIEVGHTFYLGTKYSDAIGAKFKDADGVEKVVEMGCFGIGVTRLIPAIVESQGCHDSQGIIWPLSVAPYTCTVATSYYHKNSAEENEAVSRTAESVYDKIHSRLPGDVVIDDRSGIGIGAKLKYSSYIGMPFSIIVENRYLKDGLVQVLERTTGLTRTIKLSDLDSFVDELEISLGNCIPSS